MPRGLTPWEELPQTHGGHSSSTEGRAPAGGQWKYATKSARRSAGHLPFGVVRMVSAGQGHAPLGSLWPASLFLAPPVHQLKWHQLPCCPHRRPSCPDLSSSDRSVRASYCSRSNPEFCGSSRAACCACQPVADALPECRSTQGLGSPEAGGACLRPAQELHSGTEGGIDLSPCSTVAYWTQLPTDVTPPPPPGPFCPTPPKAAHCSGLVITLCCD